MLKLKLQYFGHLMWRVDSLEKTLMLGGIGGRRKRGRQRTRSLDGITDSMDVSLSELRGMVMDREAWHAAIHGVEKSQTRLSDWTELKCQGYSCCSVAHSLWPHGLQHTRLPCPSPSPRVCSNSSNDLVLCHPLLLLPSIFPSIRVFSNELVLCIRWPKYWRFSFRISPSNEYSGLISFRINWFNLLAVSPRDSQESSLSHLESINSSVFILLYGPTLTIKHDYWKKHSFD